MTFKNKKIKYGKVELTPTEYKATKVKERITMLVDQDVLNTIRKKAKKTGTKYQTVINKALHSLAKK